MKKLRRHDDERGGSGGAIEPRVRYVSISRRRFFQSIAAATLAGCVQKSRGVGIISASGGRPTSGGGGGVVHNGDAFTVTGTGFGSKTTPAPIIYDDCSAANWAANPGWAGRYPFTNAASWLLDYRTPAQVSNNAGAGMPLPHPYSSKYMCGAHYNTVTPDGNSGYNVGPFLNNSGVANSDVWYSRGYQRADSSFFVVTGTGDSQSDGNYKFWDLSQGTDIYNGPNNWYVAYAASISNPIRPGAGVPEYVINDDSGLSGPPTSSLKSPDNNGHNVFWGTSPVRMFNAWVNQEVLLKLSSTTAGFLKIWEDNQLLVDYAGPTNNWGSILTWMFGGYARNYGSTSEFKDNWRYFSGLAFDHTAARVVVVNSATYTQDGNGTIVEYQPASSWANTTINIPYFYRGKLPSGLNYVYVFDSANTMHSAGSIVVG